MGMSQRAVRGIGLALFLSLAVEQVTGSGPCSAYAADDPRPGRSQAGAGPEQPKKPESQGEGEAAYRALLARASGQSLPQGAEAAFEAYEQIVRLYRAGRLPQVKVQRLLAEVIDPALKLGTASLLDRPALAPPVAALYGFKGRLLHDNTQRAWPFAPLVEARKAFGEAARIQRQALGRGDSPSPAGRRALANYLLWQGYLTYQLERANVARVKALAAEVRQVDPEYSGGWFLDGLAAYEAGCSVHGDPAALGPYAERAVAALNEAGERGSREQPPSEFRDLCYLLASGANLLKVNALIAQYPREPQRCRRPLEAAREDAQKVLDLRGRFAATADYLKGSAIETLAWVRADPEEYREALAAFAAGTKQDARDPLPLLGSGRVQCERFLHGAAGEEELEEARESLGRAVDLQSRRGAGSAPAVQARRWLAEVHAFLGEYARAREQFSEAVRTAPAYMLPYLLAGLRDEIGLAYRLLQDDRRESNRSRALRLLDLARDGCRLIRGRDPATEPTVAQVELSSWYTERDNKAAKEVCDRVLARQPRSLTPDYVAILLQRSAIICIEPDLWDDYLGQAQEDAERAERLAREGTRASDLHARAVAQVGDVLRVKAYALGMDGKENGREVKGALRKLEEAIRLDPSNPLAGDWRVKAAEVLAFLLSANPDTWTGKEFNVHWSRAQAYLDDARKARLTEANRKKLRQIEETLRALDR